MTWNQIPGWAKFVTSFAVGIALGVWGGAIAYADLKHTAKDAYTGMKVNSSTLGDHDERIDELEKNQAVEGEWRRSVDEKLKLLLDEVRKR